MKKFIPVVIFIIIAFITTIFLYPKLEKNFTKLEVGKVENSPITVAGSNYYQQLREDCNDDGCCASSVKAMINEGAKLAKDNICPKGMVVDTLKCPTSYKWCIEIKDRTSEDGKMNLPDDITGSEGQIEYGLYCEDASDCVIQPLNCNNCGCPTAVNKDFYKELDCSDSTNEANCNAWCPSDQIEVKCVNNSCVAELVL